MIDVILGLTQAAISFILIIAVCGGIGKIAERISGNHDKNNR